MAPLFAQLGLLALLSAAVACLRLRQRSGVCRLWRLDPAVAPGGKAVTVKEVGDDSLEVLLERQQEQPVDCKMVLRLSCSSIEPSLVGASHGNHVVLRLHAFRAITQQATAGASAAAASGSAPSLSITLAAVRLSVTAGGKARLVSLESVGRCGLCSLSCTRVCVSLMTPCSPCAQHRVIRGTLATAV